MILLLSLKGSLHRQPICPLICPSRPQTFLRRSPCTLFALRHPPMDYHLITLIRIPEHKIHCKHMTLHLSRFFSIIFIVNLRIRPLVFTFDPRKVLAIIRKHLVKLVISLMPNKDIEPNPVPNLQALTQKVSVFGNLR